MLRDSIAKFFKVDNLIGNLTGYVETRIELVKVEAKEELSKGLSTAVVYLLVAFVFALVIVFASVAVGLELAEIVGGLWAFIIISGFYLLVGGLLVAYRQPLIDMVNRRISAMLNKKK